MAASESFDVLITTIPHQQNLSRYDIGIVMLEATSNRIEDLAPLVPHVKGQLKLIAPGKVLHMVS